MTTNEMVPHGSGGVGNTKRSTPLTHWFFTWNNYTDEDVGSMVPWFTEKCKDYTVQEERGSNGTQHLQGCLSFKQKTRFEALQKLWPKVHWEKSRSSTAHQYCSKLTFEGARLWTSTKTVKTFRPSHPFFDDIENLMKIDPDYRHIYWYYDPDGNIGKSAFSKFMYVKYPKQVNVITSNKSNDILTAITGDEKLVIMDFPRCSDISYTPYRAIEQIKNGFITDCKLKRTARTLCFDIPHIVIFSNDKPDITKLSSDRWIVRSFKTEEEQQAPIP